MGKNELERIALDTLARLEAQANEVLRGQDEKIRKIENRVTGCETQLKQWSGLCQRLEPLAEKLTTFLDGGKK